MPAPSIENAAETTSFEAWDELVRWSTELSAWERWILVHAIRHRSLSAEEIAVAHKLMLRDTRLKEFGPLPSVPEIAEQVPGRPADVWTLCKIHTLQNVNALPETESLDFGPNMTLVYGRNGSGKSGFARVLSRACFSRAPAEILPDVKRADSRTPDAVIEARGPSGIERIQLSASLQHQGLTSFSVFDSQSARSQISDDANFSFTPSGLDALHEMARVFTRLKQDLEEEIARKTIKFDFSSRLPLETTSDSSARIALNDVHDNLRLDLVDEIVRTGVEDEAKLALHRQSIAELNRMSLPLERSKNEQTREQLKQLRSGMKSLRSLLGKEVANRIERQLARYRECMRIVAAESIEGFHHDNLRAIGTAEWAAFVASAESLARSESGPAQRYPALGDPCLLCHRPLDEPSAALIRHLWDFLVKPARSELEGLRSALEETKQNIARVQTNILPRDSVTRLYLSENEASVLQAVDLYIDLVEQDRASILRALEDGGPLYRTGAEPPLSLLDEATTRLDKRQATLNAEQRKSQVAVLTAACIELEARQSIRAMHPAIEQYVEVEDWCRKARRVANRLLSTRRITDKEKELFDKFVVSSYLEKLRTECELLRCDVPELVAWGHKGKTLRRFEVGAHEPHRVLSEGEQRALAIADFLTEVNLRKSSAGVIFDDPVTSMDHDRKRIIAERLVKESNRRQVIVFTHDLVFVNAIVAAIENETHLRTHWIQRNIDDKPGYVTLDDLPTLSKQYETVNPAKMSLDDARRKSGSAQVAAVRDGMGRLRRTIEEIVLKHLFKGTVSRWEEQIKIANIKQVNWSEQVADEAYALFGELSRYVEGHSHSESFEMPPGPLELQNMITRVEALVAKAKLRRPT